MPEILSKFTYPDQWGFKRTPARPKNLQVLDFDKNYDYDTVWNDAIQVSSDSMLLIGPPLYKTAQWIYDNCKFTDMQGRELSWQYSEIDRACVVRIATYSWMKDFVFETPTEKYIVKVNHARGEFSGLKTIVTISKNHPISWLKQWIDYHRTVHKIEGLLLYNNQSTIYTSEELEHELSRNDMTIKVVDYDVPFGVMGGGLWEWQGKSGDYLPWDSDFSQYVMLEHAKWRYLYCAKLVINADTDELLVIKNSNLDGVADYCAVGEHSVLLYDGVWVEPVDSRTGIIAKNIPFDNRHFSNYWHTTNGDGRGIGVKWMLNPQRNMQYQWHLHKTYGPHVKTNEITFGHYFAMNTSWSYTRDEFLGDTNNLVEFSELKDNLRLWEQLSGERR
jgi:hypothetical protein